MPEETVKDMFRREIVSKSIQIFRSHGKTDDEIKEMLLNDFSISETALDELLNTYHYTHLNNLYYQTPIWLCDCIDVW